MAYKNLFIISALFFSVVGMQQKRPAESIISPAMNKICRMQQTENPDTQAKKSPIATACISEAREEIELKCKKCGHTFASKATLRKHTKTAIIRTCCGNTFCTLSFYNYHQVTKHQMQGFVCDQCKTCYGSKCALRKHIADHNKKQGVCLICCKKFVTEIMLDNHVATQHVLDTKQLLNSYNCPGQAQSNYDLKPCENPTDWEVAAEELSDQSQEYDNSTGAAGWAEEQDFFIEDQSSEVFLMLSPTEDITETDLETEIQEKNTLDLDRNTELEVDLNEYDLPNWDEKPEDLDYRICAYIDVNNPRKCNNCNMVFTYLYFLADHIRTQHLHKPIACMQCTKEFSSRISLGIHLGMSKECKYCNALFCTDNLLKQHMHDFHNIIHQKRSAI